jgi:hypothetical protein
MVKRGATRNDVERRVGKREFLRVAALKADIVEPTTGRLGAGELDECIRCVEAGGVGTALCERHGEKARPTCHIEHAVARRDAGDGDQAGEPTLLRGLGHPGVKFGGSCELLLHRGEVFVGHWPKLHDCSHISTASLVARDDRGLESGVCK